jgi:membrane protein YdbS with pleckstrin-like domain
MFFRSKIGYELAIPIFVALGVVAALMLKMKGPISPLWIPVSLIVIIAYLFYDTTYTIKGKELEIRFGFLYKQKIDITTIREIKETNNPLVRLRHRSIVSIYATAAREACSSPLSARKNL